MILLYRVFMLMLCYCSRPSCLQIIFGRRQRGVRDQLVRSRPALRPNAVHRHDVPGLQSQTWRAGPPAVEYLPEPVSRNESEFSIRASCVAVNFTFATFRVISKNKEKQIEKSGIS